MSTKKISALAIAPLALAAFAASAAPAHAADPVNDYMVCVDGHQAGCRPVAYANGTLTWKAVGLPVVGGAVHKAASTYAVTVTFRAYYGNTVVDTQPRSVVGSATSRSYGFSIGQTYRVSKINVEVCYFASRTAAPECENEDYNRIGS
jgi:hypothetical protein